MIFEDTKFTLSSLIDVPVPSLSLRSTDGRCVKLNELTSEYVVLYAYPRTSAPGIVPLKDWDVIPGAKGCTPQSCSFRDHYNELQTLGASVFGISTQTTEYQIEAVQRLHLPFPLLSDERLDFANALSLPTFTVEGHVLFKRLTLVFQKGRVRHVMYPVMKPEENANDVVALLSEWKK